MKYLGRGLGEQKAQILELKKGVTSAIALFMSR
jgi:hypothetical protein